MDAPFPDLGSEHRNEAVPPEPNRFVADVDAALVEQILDIAKRQWKSTYICRLEEVNACLAKFVELSGHDDRPIRVVVKPNQRRQTTAHDDVAGA